MQNDIGGELVHLEDLVLDDATKNVRTPTHELTIPLGLSAAGLRSLRGRDFVSGSPAASSAADGTVEVTTDPDVDRSTEGGDESNGDVSGSAPSSSPSTRCWPDPMRPIEQATRPGRAGTRERDLLVYDLDWTRTRGWKNGAGCCGRRTTCRRCCRQSLRSMPGMFGRVLAASILRQAGVTASAHLAAINLGLETMPVERRRHRDRNFRLLALPMG